MPPRINANKAFVATKKVQILKNSSHGHSKKFISSYPLKHCFNLMQVTPVKSSKQQINVDKKFHMNFYGKKLEFLYSTMVLGFRNL